MNQESKVAKQSFWGILVFYFLVAFEFTYMASPFAAYFYSVYRPALDYFNTHPIFSWVIQYFLPHAVVETTNPIINAHNIIGAIMALVGFIGFIIGASKIYYYKLAKKGVVTGGIYRYIRHPQYAFFMLCSMGLLLLWPRYIVLMMSISMIFAYYLLAKVEEKECLKKFGEFYRSYMNETHMFFPIKMPLLKLPERKFKRGLTIASIYISSLMISLVVARGIHLISINSLYSQYQEEEVTIAVCQLDETKMSEILTIAGTDPYIKQLLDAQHFDETVVQLNYITPLEWYVAEIPMNKYIPLQRGHSSPSNYNRDIFRIVITTAILRDEVESLNEFIMNIMSREPIIEVWVDISQDKVIKILEVTDYMYKDTPVAVY